MNKRLSFEEVQEKTGGPAFPGGCLTDDYANAGEPAFDGMNLRDWFAGQALTGLLAQYGLREGDDVLAKASYSIADAMLAERRK